MRAIISDDKCSNHEFWSAASHPFIPGGHVRPFVYGLRGVDLRRHGDAFAVFRNGHVEAVVNLDDANGIAPFENRADGLTHRVHCDLVVATCLAARDVVRLIGEDNGLILSLMIVNCCGLELPPRPTVFSPLPSLRLTDRHFRLQPPESAITLSPGWSSQPIEAARLLCDRLWQSFGYDGCYLFSGDRYDDADWYDSTAASRR